MGEAVTQQLLKLMPQWTQQAKMGESKGLKKWMLLAKK
jgi:hypothetical protein